MQNERELTTAPIVQESVQHNARVRQRQHNNFPFEFPCDGYISALSFQPAANS